MPTEAIPGKTLVSVDLPKAAHALIFDRHAVIRMARDHDSLRMTLAGDGRTIEMLLDDATLATVLKLMAAALKEGAASEESVRLALRNASQSLAAVLGDHAS